MRKEPGDREVGDVGHAEVRRRFWRLTLLNILTNLTVPLASLVDIALLGHLPDIRFLAGVSLAAILFEYVYWSFGFLRMGTTGLTAQALGARRTAEVYRVLYQSLLLGGLLGAAILLLKMPLGELGFALLAGSEPIEAAGRDYFDARIWGAPAALLNFGFLGWFLGREESRHALLMTAVAHGLNVALDYVFIVRLGLAARGAGIATAISQYAMLATAVVIFLRSRPVAESTTKNSSLPFFAWRQVVSATELTRFLRLNRDILIRTVLLISAFALFLNFSALLGTVTLAANTILYRLQLLVAYFVDGAAFATESLAGIFRGGRQERALSWLRRYALGVGVGFALPFAVLVLVTPRALYRLLTSHTPTLEVALAYGPWLVPTMVLGALAFIYDGYFLGLTRGRSLRNAMLLSTLVVFLPLALLALRLESNHLLWLAIVAFMAARSGTLGWIDRRRLCGQLSVQESHIFHGGESSTRSSRRSGGARDPLEHR